VVIKPIALQIADMLDQHLGGNFGVNKATLIAAELRRLYVENNELKENLEKKSIAIQKIWSERDKLQKLNQEVVDALFVALPFVEDAADDEIYKSHRVHAVLKQIQTAIKNCTGESNGI